MKHSLVFFSSIFFAIVGAASAGYLRGAIHHDLDILPEKGPLPPALASAGTAFSPAAAAPTPTPAPTPARTLTGQLENRMDHVHAAAAPVHPSRVEPIGTPPLQTLQGQALGPTELPVLLPFASPYVATP